MTNKERLKAYGNLFHTMQLAEVCGNHKKIADGLDLIFKWSYAHRAGNGEPSDYEQQQMIDSVTKRMAEF